MSTNIRLLLMICIFIAATIRRAPAADTNPARKFGTASQIHIKARFIEVPKEFLAASTFFTNAVAGPMTGIMSDSNLHTLLHALSNQRDVETLAEPEVVTMSGRHTQMRANEMASPLPLLAENGTQSHASSQVVSPQVANTNIVVSLDLVSYFLADGYTINLTAIPGTGPSAQIMMTVNLRDNQTFVFGNLPGRADADRQVIVLVTATIVDPAGNRVHADDATFSVPPQPQAAASSGSSLPTQK